MISVTAPPRQIAVGGEGVGEALEEAAWYFGSWKGAAQTLNEGAGNDYDQVSLLIALLRVSGFPARYVRGTIRVPIERAVKWTGVTDPAQVVLVLANGRIPAQNLFEAGNLAAVQFEHVWVETYVPYGSYRGTLESQADKTWIPLDPSFKLQERQEPLVDFFTSGGFNPQIFLDTYVSELRTETPLDFYRGQVEAFLAGSHPGLRFEDTLQTGRIRAQRLGILPNSLPYKLIEAKAEWREVPEELRYSVDLEIFEGTTPLATFSSTLSNLAGKALGMGYLVASSEDEAVAREFGGVLATPPYLVRLSPFIELDGEKVVRSETGVGLGTLQQMRMTFRSPGRVARAVVMGVTCLGTLPTKPKGSLWAQVWTRHIQPLEIEVLGTFLTLDITASRPKEGARIGVESQE